MANTGKRVKNAINTYLQSEEKGAYLDIYACGGLW